MASLMRYLLNCVVCCYNRRLEHNVDKLQREKKTLLADYERSQRELSAAMAQLGVCHHIPPTTIINIIFYSFLGGFYHVFVTDTE
jgi:hypothetical protein